MKQTSALNDPGGDRLDELLDLSREYLSEYRHVHPDPEDERLDELLHTGWKLANKLQEFDDYLLSGGAKPKSWKKG